MEDNSTRRRSRRSSGESSVVVAEGSVWERRMKSDEVKGGIKVFNAEEEEGIGRRLKKNTNGVVSSGGKRKTWKSEKNSEDGIMKSPILNTRKVGVFSDKSERRSIIHTRKLRSEKEGGELSKEQLLKSKKSDSMKKNNSDSDSGSGESRNVIDGSDGTICEKGVADENLKNDCDENCNDFEVCKEKIIQSNSDNVIVVDNEVEEEVEEEIDEEVEIEIENETFDVKEISIPESNSMVVVKEPETKKIVVHEPEKVVVVSEVEKKKKVLNESEPKKIVSAQMRFHHRNEKPVSAPIAIKQSSPIRRHRTIYQNFSKANSISKAEEYHSFPQTQTKLQSLVDLIMWRDASRSAFIFGFGTFVIVSSSYAKDINLSVVSVMSYIGLIYLAVIFLYRSLICRGVINVEDSNYVIGEEEAIWVLKMFLPYLNEFLSKLKALFSGDPGTTIKLAVLLFVLARCGSCITIWKMGKVGFFVVFTIPKICSSYSAQLTAYANFWIHRFRDAWDSCSHKKAVALGIFGLVWNLSSVIARIWAVFVLFVAFRYYQQHYLVIEESMEDEAECDETWQEPVGVGHKKGCIDNFIDTNKVKKGF
ncbi:PREDICTED: reticulon-like protein B21 isoform X2 [Lupinus angustifolius]|uniref:reticulon-like protein B21 isoform X2 n=1 Tax=Lupinus angustifolius TaxID=3871 RepID=UPI00092F1F69|nr:PREDICTED: reticulon-like protein B21 isoform X2 [Lupinus angustifolius]